jgi:tetratricopeptide (TPR) repeat protein
MTISGAATTGPDGLALLGDIHAALGEADAAERAYQLAEAAWSSDAPEPARLARFLAERGRRVAAALDIAVSEAARRQDIFTGDTLAWALYQAGRLDEAQAAIERALRTGSRDRTIRYHAAAIAAARGDRQAARTFVSESLAGAPAFDVVAAAGAARLQQALQAGGHQ